MSETQAISIRTLIERILQGIIRIPKFQRGFVWEAENVAFLMDSIYRGYPIGTALLWRSQERLTSERDLGPFKLPEPEKKWPVDYVLDGQQRITSLFGVFQTKLEPETTDSQFDVYFDLDAPDDAREEHFIYKSKTEEISDNLLSLRLLLDPGPFAVRTRDMTPDHLAKAVELQRRFQEAQIKTEIVDTTDREQIAMIFERINRSGVPLDTFQLLTAWTWSTEFDLNEKIESLGSELQLHGFVNITDRQDLIMKCCSAIISGDASTRAIIGLHGPVVRDRFETIKRGVIGAVEFLHKQLDVHSLEIMPYPAMLVPLARFFATDAVSGFHPTSKQLTQLKRWFWKNCLSRRYSSSVDTVHAADIAAMDSLKSNENYDIAKFDLEVDPKFFITNQFNSSAVNSKTFILLLASRTPLSLISGATINLEEVLLRCNRNEFHHIFPRKHLINAGVSANINALANFCFLSGADNQKIKDKAPSDYIAMIDEDVWDGVFQRALIPNNWHQMSYEQFLDARSRELATYANSLI